MAQIDKFTAFLKPGNSWVMEGNKKVGQKKKGSTVTNTSISGRASTSRSGRKIASNSGKGGGGSASKAPTVKSSAKNVVSRLKSGNVTGAVISAKNLGRTTKKAVTGAAKSAAKTASSKVSLAKIKYKPKLRDAKESASSTAKSWGSAAQKAAIKKLADFNRGKKRMGSAAKKTITRKAVKYGLRSGSRYGGNSGK